LKYPNSSHRYDCSISTTFSASYVGKFPPIFSFSSFLLSSQLRCSLLLLLILSLHNAGMLSTSRARNTAPGNIFIVIIIMTIKIIVTTHKFAERYLIMHTSRWCINILSI
jgi:hypothetical protein